MRPLLPLPLALVCACGAGGSGTLQARLVLQTHDTLRFTAGASARRCARGRGFIVQGADGGSGVLLWLRSADSGVAGTYAVLARGDTLTPRGAVGGVRFILKSVDRGITLDSGIVNVAAAGGRFAAHVRGSGIDPNAAQRVAVDAAFDAVSLAADTANCRIEIG